MSALERLTRARLVLTSLRPWRRRLLTLGALVVTLFAGIALLQHEYVHTSFLRSVDKELAGWALEVRNEVAYKGKWNLSDYRNRSAIFAPRWWIIARDGLVVDLIGLTPNVFSHVQLVGDGKFGSPSTVITSINESWRILAKQIKGGTVVVGISAPDDLTEADATLASNIERFGTSLAQAVAVRERQIDSDVDYAVVDTDGALANAYGGVPLMMNVSSLPVALDTESAVTVEEGDRYYRLLSLPIRGTGDQWVGAIVVPKDITGELGALANQDRFNLVLVVGSLVSLILIALFFVLRELTRRRGTPSIEEALRVGESKTVEFKSTYQWDPDKGEAVPDKRPVILKAVTGFLNADGGTLYIGICEDKSGHPSVCGLKNDLEVVSGNMDRLRRDLVHLIASRVGTQFSPFIFEHVETHGDHLCWIVSVQRAPKPAFVSWHGSKKFYVREGPRTVDLDNESTYRYIENRWG